MIGRALASAAFVALLGASEPSFDPAKIDTIGRSAIGSAASGVSITIARDGVVVYGGGFGTIARDGALPVDARTRFPIGSITKQFTAAAVELLALDDKLRIDAPLATYLPDAPHAREVTLRQLLQQTSGFASYTAQPGFLTTFATSQTVTPREMLATIAYEPLDFVPGTQYAYSNTNYLLLGAVIEAVSHRSYADFVHERIAVPLGLTTLTFGPPADTANVVLSGWTSQAYHGAGGLYAAPADLARWDAAFFGGKLVPQDIVTEMTTPPAIIGATLPYAFGWVNETVSGHHTIWHDGAVDGASVRNDWFPESHVAVVVFGNATTFDPTPLVRAIAPLVEATP